MVRGPDDVVRDVHRALSTVRDHLQQEADKITAASGATTSAAIKGDPLLVTFYKASRQLSKLKSSLLLETDEPGAHISNTGGDVSTRIDLRKAKSALNKVEKAAEAKYQASMLQLSSSGTPGAAYQEQLVEARNHATEVALAALTFLTNGFEKLHLFSSQRSSTTPTTAAPQSTVTTRDNPSASAGTTRRSSSSTRASTRERRRPLSPNNVEQGARPERRLPRTQSERMVTQRSAEAARLGGAGLEVNQRALVHRCRSERSFELSSQHAPQHRSSHGPQPYAAGATGDDIPSSPSSIRDRERSALPDNLFSSVPSTTVASEAASSDRALSAFPARRVSSVAAATNERTRSAAPGRQVLGLSPVTRGGKVWRQSLAVAAGERRAKSRAAAAAAAAAQPSSSTVTNGGVDRPNVTGSRQSKRSHHGERRNGKLSPEEQQPATHWDLEPVRTRSTAAGRRHLLEVSNGIMSRQASAVSAVAVEGASVDTMTTAASLNINRVAARHVSRPQPAATQWMSQFDNGDADSGAGVPRASRRRRTPAPTGSGLARAQGTAEGAMGGSATDHQLTFDATAAQAMHEAEMAEATVSDAALAALLAASANPLPLPQSELTATRTRRRSLGEPAASDRWAAAAAATTIGDEGVGFDRGLPGVTAVAERHTSAASNLFDTANESSSSYGAREGGRTGRSSSPDADSDEATALRLAKQEQDAQAYEDAMLAFHLAAMEDATREERAARARRRAARQRNAEAAPHGLDPAIAAAAFATEGSAVSEAVRALQFQDIDENDFETLLGLDEVGGTEGRCCSGERGLTEAALEATLQPTTASGVRLDENCAICMSDYELGEETCGQLPRMLLPEQHREAGGGAGLRREPGHSPSRGPPSSVLPAATSTTKPVTPRPAATSSAWS